MNYFQIRPSNLSMSVNICKLGQVQLNQGHGALNAFFAHSIFIALQGLSQWVKIQILFKNANYI